MSKITWDAEGKRTYETGIKYGVLYPKGTDGEYKGGVAWNGLSSVSESPEGAEAEKIYADDMKYLELRSAEELNITIEAYTYPDEFAECDGTAEPIPGMAIMQQTRKPFGLCYRTTVGNDTELDNYGYKLHLIYGCVASPSEKQYQTVNDSPEAITFSWEVTTTPVNVTIGDVTYKPTARIVLDSHTLGKDKMAAIENILYGTTSDEPRLPMPSEVYTVLSNNTTS